MTDQPSSSRLARMKRSRALQLTSLMATVGFSASACGGPAPTAAAPEPALAYTTLDECRAADVIPDTECERAQAAAWSEAEQSSPRYATRAECEGQWGPEQCRPLGGGSFFGPLAAGFIVGSLLNGGYRYGGPLYRDRYGGYSNGFGGGGLYRDYRTGRTYTNLREHSPAYRSASTRTQSRSPVVSRGGFGGGSRGYGG